MLSLSAASGCGCTMLHDLVTCSALNFGIEIHLLCMAASLCHDLVMQTVPLPDSPGLNGDLSIDTHGRHDRGDIDYDRGSGCMLSEVRVRASWFGTGAHGAAHVTACIVHRT